MQPIKNVLQHHNLSTHSGIAAKVASKTMKEEATSLNSVDSERLTKRIDKLFLKMAAMYGHVWRSLYKSDAFLAFTKTEWSKGLMRFDDKTVDKALLSCLSNWELPPTLPQFVDCCKAYTKRMMYEKDVIKPCTPAVAEANLNQIKNFLNMQ